MIEQQGDVFLYQTDNGGEITVENGIVTMNGGLQTAAYLSMFGGNEDDTGSDKNKFTWWGNLDENQENKKYISETQNLLQSLTMTTSNLIRVEDAVKRDLAWFDSGNITTEISVVATIPGLNKLHLVINLVAEGEESTLEFTENWKVEG